MSNSSSRPPEPPGPSFPELVRTYRAFILRLAERQGVLPADAEDVAQLVLHALWQEIQRQGMPVQTQAWLIAVTRRVAINYRHGRLGWRLDRLEDGEETVADLVPSSELLCLAREQVALVSELLAALRPERAEVLRRHELEGERLVAIARQQGIPIGTVHTRLRLAREDFKALYERWLKRAESKERRGVMLMFAFLHERSSLVPAAPQPRSPWLAVSFQALAALLFVLVATLDTPLRRSGDDIAVQLPAESAARTLPLLQTPSPDAEPAHNSPPSPDHAPRKAAPYTTSSPAPRHSPPPRPRDLETARIHLHVAARMAAENQPNLAAQALHGYEVRAPDNPLPATKAALQSDVRPSSPGKSTGVVPDRP